MHVGIDHARQHMQPAALDHLAGRGARQVANRGNTPGMDADIATTLAIVIDDGAALENQIVAVSHALTRVNGA